MIMGNNLTPGVTLDESADYRLTGLSPATVRLIGGGLFRAVTPQDGTDPYLSVSGSVELDAAGLRAFAQATTALGLAVESDVTAATLRAAAAQSGLPLATVVALYRAGYSITPRPAPSE